MVTTQCTPTGVEERERQAGYHYGLNDNYIAPWKYPAYPSSFILGYLEGKAEIDRLVDDAWHANQSYGEHL